MIERILDNYYSNKLKDIIDTHLFLKYLIDIKMEERKDYFELKIKKQEYKDEMYVLIGRFWKCNSFVELVDVKDTLKRIEKSIDKYLEENK